MSWLMAKDWVTGVEYSSLFHSGLRVISRPRARRARTCSSSSSSSSGVSSASGDSSTSLSSRLLRRCTTRTRHPSLSVSTSREPSPAPPSRAANVSPRPSSMFVRPTKEMDGWSSRTSFELGDYSKFPDVGYRLPPIELNTGCSRSFVVNLGEMDAEASSPNSPDELLHRPHECPASLPSGGDYAWMLEDSSPELEVYDHEEEEGGEIRAETDWRQFHVDWVLSIH